VGRFFPPLTKKRGKGSPVRRTLPFAGALPCHREILTESKGAGRGEGKNFPSPTLSRVMGEVAGWINFVRSTISFSSSAPRVPSLFSRGEARSSHTRTSFADIEAGTSFPHLAPRALPLRGETLHGGPVLTWLGAPRTRPFLPSFCLRSRAVRAGHARGERLCGSRSKKAGGFFCLPPALCEGEERRFFLKKYIEPKKNLPPKADRQRTKRGGKKKQKQKQKKDKKESKNRKRERDAEKNNAEKKTKKKSEVWRGTSPGKKRWKIGRGGCVAWGTCSSEGRVEEGRNDLDPPRSFPPSLARTLLPSPPAPPFFFPPLFFSPNGAVPAFLLLL
jgi:hypothetical protein